MTAAELIALADELAPNAFSDRVKLWELNRLELRIRLDILQQDPDDVEPITAAEMDETELALGEAYEDVYLFWMKAMYYFHMGEAETYQNEKSMFDQAWNRFVRDVCYEQHQGTGPEE